MDASSRRQADLACKRFSEQIQAYSHYSATAAVAMTYRVGQLK